MPRHRAFLSGPSTVGSILFTLVLLACLSLTSANAVRYKSHTHFVRADGSAVNGSAVNATATPTNTTGGVMRIQGGTLTDSATMPKVTDCSTGQRCTLGCCSTGGFCGYGPDYCAANVCNAKLSANGTCAQLSECDAGGYPGYGALWGEYASGHTRWSLTSANNHQPRADLCKGDKLPSQCLLQQVWLL